MDFLFVASGINLFALELLNKMINQTIENLCDKTNITIFPVPIENNTFTTRISSDENVMIGYKVIDDQGFVHYQRQHNIREGQIYEIIKSDVNLPNGLIFHTFEIENNCSRTITTIKNE